MDAEYSISVQKWMLNIVFIRVQNWMLNIVLVSKNGCCIYHYGPKMDAGYSIRVQKWMLNIVLGSKNGVATLKKVFYNNFFEFFDIFFIFVFQKNKMFSNFLFFDNFENVTVHPVISGDPLYIYLCFPSCQHTYRESTCVGSSFFGWK